MGIGIAGLILEAAAGGAIQLQNIEAQYQAATGAGIQEAHDWAMAMNDLASKNVDSFETIAAVSTKVHQSLGLTGQAQVEYTQKVLDFSRATGVDAVAAVDLLDNAMKTWGLTQAQIPGLMDQLVASEQRYGGSVADRLDLLQRLGPALQALNLTEDQSVGLMNLAIKAGMSLDDVQRGLNTAVKQLPPGTNLWDYLQTLSQVPDSAERAREATNIFGTQAGPKMALLLAPGKGAISDYIVTAGQVPGATDTAAAAVDSTWSATFTKLLNDAKSLARGLGDEFGPLGSFMAGTALLAPQIAGVFTKLGLNTAVSTAAGAAGGAAGAIYGAAVGVGAALAGVITTMWQAAGEGAELGGAAGAIRAAGTAAGTLFGGAAAAAAALAIPTLIVGVAVVVGKPILDALPDIQTQGRGRAAGGVDSGNTQAWAAAGQAAGTIFGQNAGTSAAQAFVQTQRDRIHALISTFQAAASVQVTAYEQQLGADLAAGSSSDLWSKEGSAAAAAATKAGHLAGKSYADAVADELDKATLDRNGMFARMWAMVGQAAAGAARAAVGRSASVPSTVPRR